MLDKISISRYYYGNSLIHQWNPISKLICSLCFIICTCLIQQMSVIILLMIVLLLLLFSSNIPFSYYGKAVWNFRYFLLFFFLFNYVCQMPIEQNILLLCKLILIGLYSTMILFTTPIGEFTLAISVLLYPLTWIHIPVNLISRMISLSISFLSTLMQQANNILKTLAVRGIHYDSGSVKQKLYIWRIILLPIFIGAFRHADDIAYTMEIRCYSLEVNNQGMCKISLRFFDLLQLALHVLIIVLVWKEGML